MDSHGLRPLRDGVLLAGVSVVRAWEITLANTSPAIQAILGELF